jgi:hypothetical protein
LPPFKKSAAKNEFFGPATQVENVGNFRRLKMNATIKHRLTLTGVFALLGATGMVMNSRRAAADPPDGQAVRIVNPLPVPITGSITASGTVAATQSGSWNVGIAGNSEVNPLWIRDADNPARHPFLLTGTTPANASFFAVAIPVGSVPAGQRYVIEHYSAQCTLTPSGALTDINVFVSGGPSDDSATPHLTDPTHWQGSGNTRLYADPGAAINVDFRSVSGAMQMCSASVSGYSVALP